MDSDATKEFVKDVKILIVDDHFSTRDLVKSILRSVGFVHIVQADSGYTALMRLKEEQPDIIICDWNMPQMSGIELLRAVRKNNEFQSIPFLMLTAEVYKENVKEAIESGVTDYISKPFTAETLIKKLMEILQPSTSS